MLCRAECRECCVSKNFSLGGKCCFLKCEATELNSVCRIGHHSFALILQIDNEEYGDALQLARTYQLDCDLVYQQQWSNSIISKATIEDYLVSTGYINNSSCHFVQSRVTKQQWVMSECLYRVTDDYNAMNDLLKYGLIRTNISQVVPDLSTEMTGTQLMEEVLRGIER